MSEKWFFSTLLVMQEIIQNVLHEHQFYLGITLAQQHVKKPNQQDKHYETKTALT